MRKVMMLPALAFAIASAAPAFADDDYVGGPNVPRDQWLSVGSAIEKIGAQGYKVLEIEADDGTYEFEAINADGGRIEGHAHPATGAVLSTHPDND